MDNLQESGLSAEGAKLALHKLLCERKAATQTYRLANEQYVQLVKVGAPTAKITVNISDQELRTFNLKETVKLQRDLCHNLEMDILTADEIVRKNVTENKRVAKMHLKRKHGLEQQLGK